MSLNDDPDGDSGRSSGLYSNPEDFHISGLSEAQSQQLFLRVAPHQQKEGTLTYQSEESPPTLMESSLLHTRGAGEGSASEADDFDFNNGARYVSTLSYCKLWIAFFYLGLANNIAYVVVLSGAKEIADRFNGNLIGALQWALVGFGFGGKLLNAYILDLSYSFRIMASSVILTGGLAMVAMFCTTTYWMTLVGILFLGFSCSFGESLFLGYLKDFDPLLVGAWSSGTGMAGVGGTVFYLLLHSVLKLSDIATFLLLIPFCVVYWLVFKYIDSSLVSMPDASGYATPALEEGGNHTALDRTTTAHSAQAAAPHGYRVPASSRMRPGTEEEERADAETKCQQFCRIWPYVSSPAIQLAAVYFFEYVASVGFAAKANRNADKNDWWSSNAYPVLQFCYQFGVLISRSSVSVFPVKQLGLLTFLQACNFVLWMSQVLTPFLTLWLQCVLMVWVGLLGGAMYVNTFHSMVGDTRLSIDDREFGINIASILINIGITTSSIFEIVAAVTFLPQGD